MSKKNCGRKNCGHGEGGCHNGCHNRNTCNSCCDAIEKNMGRYFLESSQVGNSDALNSTFCDLDELIARSQMFEQFIAQENAAIRAAFVALSDCKRCNNQCCTGTSEAIANAGIGYVNLAFQAVLSKGNPITSVIPALNLQQVLADISAGSSDTINTILIIAGCNIDI